MQLIHFGDSHVDLEHEGVQLFRYVYSPQTAAIESTRPYFHPIRTLSGNVVSGFRPHDHRWHHGLSMTSAHLSGHNFWGGRTYVSGEGYKQLANNGLQIQSLDEPLQVISNQMLSQNLIWAHANGAPLSGETDLNEHRLINFEFEADYWILDFHSQFDYIGPESTPPLVWGSPTTQGRELAGYGGLFWRGPRDFLGGKILMSDGREGPELMGEKSPWLAYIGQHDETDAHSTLIFIDDEANPRYPTPWFVRNTTPMVCPNFAFAEEYIQKPNQTLMLNYKILIADGAWERDRIEAEVANFV